MFPNENSNGSFLAHHHAIKKNTKMPVADVVLGELTKQTRSKKAEERLELKIMEKTLRSRNKNLF